MQFKRKQILVPFTILVFFVLFLSSKTVFDKNKEHHKSIPSKRDSFQEINLLFAGDVMAHLPQIEAARTDSFGHFDFSPEFQYVSDIIKKADISVVNLETTFGGKPYMGYPQFSAPDTLAWFLKKAGFNLIADANNHAADRGMKGILGTIHGLNRFGLAHTGTFKDSAERAKNYPYIIDKNGIRLAFLNYTYGTNNLIVHPPVIVNYIDTAQIKKDIQTARKKKAEVIIAVMHWGIEYQVLPNEEQKRIARFCFTNGIDVIIGSHPHVVQPAYWENYRRKGDTIDRKGLVLYSLGNFVSNQRDKYTDGGILFSFNIKKNRYSKTISITDPSFLPTWVYIRPAPKSYFILPANDLKMDSSFVRDAKDRIQMIESFEHNKHHMLEDAGLHLDEIK